MRKPKYEEHLVWEFLGSSKHGTFVDVGANHPVEGNQTWFLEQQGWNGVLIEPNPNLTPILREQRLKSKTFQVIAGSPAQTGETEFHIFKSHRHSTPNPDCGKIGVEKIRVPVRTLDSILQESGLTEIDFLSLDVEGMELDVLDGFNLEKWKPRLILIEDFCYNRRKRVYLRNRGYKLVRRTGYNNWYVPRESPHSLFSVSSPSELFFITRKIWISGPIIGARRAFRRWRKERKR